MIETAEIYAIAERRGVFVQVVWKKVIGYYARFSPDKFDPLDYWTQIKTADDVELAIDRMLAHGAADRLKHSNNPTTIVNR